MTAATVAISKKTPLAEEVETSRAMLYRNIKELADHGFIEPKDGEGYRLTEAGLVVRL